MTETVDVWHSTLDLPEVSRASLSETLSPDERERAARFLLPEDARRWELTRGLLREVLGHCCHIAPHALRFDIGRHGKPSLAGSIAREARALEFNLSHCADRAGIHFDDSPCSPWSPA